MGFCVIAALALTASPALAQDIWVADGDTIHLDGVAYRLEGIDAPEMGQTCRSAQGHPFDCGKAARKALQRMIGVGPVSCQPDGKDRYGRILAHCSGPSGELNRAMVDAGLARAYLRYSGEYLADESEAMTGHVGLWAGSWDAPWDWRHRP